ncbi:general stress protein [Siminovitchia acidinfaciens]|uniref:General stress protein n=1 Tax=Siminovitchia acidinfaciens TaxID=2321395 RepID=A0A429Y6F9_9BACI|nr:general stress protein [Siminovitchia acidinfaciens]RST77020.1 general stress protein [Siminovitchia acidinfaciens]VEF46405.1 general stress protein 17M [Bacillus freudenreichii]
MNTIKVCENGLQAKDMINELTAQGYDRENIYLFAHGEERSKDLTDALDTGEVGIGEQGLIDSVKNIFNKRGDELRSEFEAVGLSHEEASKYEKVLDGGELVLVATKH